MKKVLLFPGAFNPPHKGHIALVQAAVGQIPFDEVWIMPSGRRDDGKVISINYEHRRNLNRLFTSNLQTLLPIPVILITAELDDVEDLGTQEHIRRIKLTPDTEVVQLIGSDAYNSLLKHDLIIEGERFLVFKRAGDKNDCLLNQGDQLFDIELPLISSTMVRSLVQAGDKQYLDLIPEEISEYISTNNLYN